MRKINKVGIVGAGLMGAEIACMLLFFNKYVVIKDVSSQILENALEKCKTFFLRYLKKGKLTEEEYKNKLKLLIPTLEYDDFINLDLIIEAVNENIELKTSVLKEIDVLCSKEAILATNTSGLSISQIASFLSYPQRFLGMHFFYPATIMRLVEVVKGRQTEEKIISEVLSFCKDIRKIPVVVKDTPGFLVNRILCALLLEAVKCYEEGIDIEIIDKSMIHQDIGLPVGPFSLADSLGLDVVYYTLQVLTKGYNKRFYVPDTIFKLVNQNKLGLKTNEGFYKYPKNIDNSSTENLDIAKRIMTAAVMEARDCENEGIADRKTIDLAMMAAAGFKKPPFVFAQENGI